MKKSKLSLDTLKVKSFVTSIESDKILAGFDPDSYNDGDSDGGDRCKNTEVLCFTQGCKINPTEECNTLRGCDYYSVQC